MSDHQVVTPEADAEIRFRLRAFADEVGQRADTQVALERLRRRKRRPITNLMAIAASVLAVVALTAALRADGGALDVLDTADSPTQTTNCPKTTQRRAITLGGPMNTKFLTPLAGAAAAAILLFGACSEDNPTTPAATGPKILARGDVKFIGNAPLSGQTMVIDAEEDDGKVSGTAKFREAEVSFECADTATDGLVIVGGKVTVPSGSNTPAIGELMAVIIREGEPDSGGVWLDQGESDSCDEMLKAIPEESRTGGATVFAPVADGDNIETS